LSNASEEDAQLLADVKAFLAELEGNIAAE